jgi:hypothetical protein
MELGWEKLFKRYVWHDEKTPYLTRVAHLSLAQARYELRAYAVLMSVLFGAAALAALAPAAPHAGAALVALYAFSVCCAAVLLGFTRHPWAALWCAGAPFALLGYFAIWGFHPRLESEDKWVLVAVVLAVAAYSPRVVAVARTAHRLDEGA